MEKHHFTDILQKRLTGVNLTKLARELKIPKAILHDWVRARRLPSLKNIEYVKLLADHLNLSLEEILVKKIPKRQNYTLKTIKFEDDGNKYLIEVIKIGEK